MHPPLPFVDSIRVKVSCGIHRINCVLSSVGWKYAAWIRSSTPCPDRTFLLARNRKSSRRCETEFRMFAFWHQTPYPPMFTSSFHPLLLCKGILSIFSRKEMSCTSITRTISHLQYWSCYRNLPIIRMQRWICHWRKGKRLQERNPRYLNGKELLVCTWLKKRKCMLFYIHT